MRTYVGSLGARRNRQRIHQESVFPNVAPTTPDPTYCGHQANEERERQYAVRYFEIESWFGIGHSAAPGNPALLGGTVLSERTMRVMTMPAIVTGLFAGFLSERNSWVLFV